MRVCRAQQSARYALQLRWRGCGNPCASPAARQCTYATEATTNINEPGNRTLAVSSTTRFNEVGVQHVSDHIHSQLFSSPTQPPSQNQISLSRKHLARHDLLGRNQDASPPIGLDIPKLQGQCLDEHFHRLGMDAAEPYLSLAKKFARANPPPRPRKWIKKSGWTKYAADGSVEAVPAPNESAIAFDIEVMWKETNFPAMACAVSADAWYGWLSPWLLGESDTVRHLIPLGDPNIPRLIVGHNIGYDRARVREEYGLEQTKNYFMDTMSLHVAVNGMCTRQRPTWVKHRKARDLRDQIANSEEGADLSALLQRDNMDDDEEEHLWIARSSVNSLRDVAQFHCGVTIDKAKREWFSELDRQGILTKYDELLDYCAADVDITHRVYRKVFPAFLETCPHPVNFAALRHLSTEILPVNEAWEKYITNAESTYHRLLESVQERLIDLTNKALEIKDQPEAYQDDPWLGQLDWSGQEIKYTKPKKKGDEPRPVKRQKMPGMPAWYKDLFLKADGPMNLTVRTRIAPLLLRLSWEGHPLVWSSKHGWTFKVSAARAQEYKGKSLVECSFDDDAPQDDIHLKLDRLHRYFKLPHKDGPSARCVNPLAKGYLVHFERGTLTSEYSYAKEALEMNASCSYWISARERIKSQMVVYNADLRSDGDQGKQLGFILPQVVPMGTITRRAVENTWLTASNAKANRVGSELKSMIQAPPGYVFVGADVDSEELWIASLMGDAQFKMHGGNALGFMTLEGEKNQGTDLHSRTAKILGISRNDAKVFNYGRIYGAGLNFAGTLLKQFNPDLTSEQATSTAQKLYTSTKGAKTSRKQLHKRAFWRNGTESLVFNTLEDFAEQERPRTPILGAGITEALMRRYISKGEFMTSRVNWAIQSSGVDYLHLLIVAMEYLTKRFNIAARLAITVHDEIRYLVKEEDKYRAAMALQISNLWTRAMFSQQVGIDDLPQQCAFFSAVDIDHVLRKEVDMDCVTPSHLEAIPPGESLDLAKLLEKGESAKLDDTTVPYDPPRPDRFQYTERVPVMKQLQQDIDLPYLRAQIADDTELKDILKEAKPSSKTMSEPSTGGQSSASGARTPSKLKARKKTSGGVSSVAPSKSTSSASVTSSQQLPKGVFLYEALPLEERLIHQAWKSKSKFSVNNGVKTEEGEARP